MYEVAQTHYIARITIERVDHMQEPAKQYVQDDKAKPAGRKVTELAAVTVRNDELDSLKGKVGAHIALVDDIVAIDERTPSKSNLRMQQL